MLLDQSPSHATQRAPRRRSDGRFFVFLFVVSLALGVGVVVKLRPYLAGPSTPTPALSASHFNDYTAFFDQYGATLPEGLSVQQVTSRANYCAGGTMPPNRPVYLELLGPQTGVPHSQCPAPGTNDWWDVVHPGTSRSVVARRFIVHGHIIGKSLGGEGSAVDGQGRCVNMTPQSTTPNTQMGQQAERRARELAAGAPTVAFFYLVVAPYAGKNYMPIGMFPFIISPTVALAPGPFLNEANHIALAESAP